ncbi:AtpZ/AtpI family protein [Thiomicrorhabdus lithotrophica]|uniref:AtpZ/AtpI family protein n=1 Tax=Thiomicrorhabdus lithotrophica TaxID=2949997 RepID=A0ABY8CAV4_9GAMM|nr:AtpZ/AtpI family protein [Thiomicrorhabdus lithotrophica]WEJ62622.1 AtpZ/AtpI family protein [Thiomicrorhabdus lithotrophica]
MNDENEHKKITAEDEKAPGLAANYLLMGAGSMFTSMLIAGFIVGYFLDQIFDTTPIFFLSCAVLGFIGGIQQVHKLSKRLDYMAPKAEKETEDDKKSG